MGSRMPSSESAPMDRPALVGNPEDWAELCCGAEGPKSLQDYVSSDRPVTGLHIVSFKDANDTQRKALYLSMAGDKSRIVTFSGWYDNGIVVQVVPQS